MYKSGVRCRYKCGVECRCTSVEWGVGVQEWSEV